MDSRIDLTCSCTLVLLAIAIAAWSRMGADDDGGVDRLPERVRATALPTQLCRTLLAASRPLVRMMLTLGISANAITLLSLLAGVAAGVMIACGHFGVAGLLFIAASCGDALDGLVARATHTESAGGALLDASVDRYEEFFAFGGLAIFFRSSELLLTLTLIALAGSFMVSYGSAQAEARHLTVPPGLMRRPERATCLALGVIFSPIATVVARTFGGDARFGAVPAILALAVIGVVANVCAVRRIRAIAAAMTPTRMARDTSQSQTPTHTTIASASAG